MTPMRRTVAYVVKGYPRLSETFIASEIYRLEQAGTPLRLFVLKPVEEHERAAPHAVVRRIQARPIYLPATSGFSGVSRLRWLARSCARAPPRSAIHSGRDGSGGRCRARSSCGTCCSESR
jgi:hypothetical protein